MMRMHKSATSALILWNFVVHVQVAQLALNVQRIILLYHKESYTINLIIIYKMHSYVPLR